MDMIATDNLLSVLLILHVERGDVEFEIDERKRRLAMFCPEFIRMGCRDEHIPSELWVRNRNCRQNIGVACNHGMKIVGSCYSGSNEQCHDSSVNLLLLIFALNELPQNVLSD